MPSITDIVASIQDIDDLDKYRDRSEKELRVLRGIVSTLRELRDINGGDAVADRLIVATDNERKFLIKYAEVLERAYAKICQDQPGEPSNTGENMGVDEVNEADEAEEAEESPNQLEETFYESDIADTASNYSGISDSVFDAIRLPPHMLDNGERIDLSPIPPPTPPPIIVSDTEDDSDDEDGFDAFAVDNWFNQNMDWTIFSNGNDRNAVAAGRGECIICTDTMIEGRIVDLECNHSMCLGCLYNIFHLMDDDVIGRCPFCRKVINLYACNRS